MDVFSEKKKSHSCSLEYFYHDHEVHLPFCTETNNSHSFLPDHCSFCAKIVFREAHRYAPSPILYRVAQKECNDFDPLFQRDS